MGWIGVTRFNQQNGGRPFGSTGTATAVPDATGVTLVMPRRLREVRIEIGPDATDHDGQTGIEGRT